MDGLETDLPSSAWRGEEPCRWPIARPHRTCSSGHPGRSPGVFGAARASPATTSIKALAWHLVGHVRRQSATQAVDALYPGHITARQKVSWLLSTKGEPISRALQGRAGLLSSSQPVRAA